MILFELTVLLVLVLVNGFLAGSEIAIVALRKTRVDELVASRSGNAAAIERLRAHPESFLATVQIGITFIGAAAGAFGGASMARDLEPVLRPLAGQRASSLAFVVVVVVISFLSLVLGELVPKSLALRSSERYALLAARPLLALAFLSRPLVWLLTRSSNVVLRLFGDSTTFVEARLSPGELRQLVGEATEAGSVDPSIGEITSRAIDFGATTVAHIMVPRHRVVSVTVDVSREELRRVVLEEGKSRIVVFDEEHARVLGYVTVRDAVVVMEEGSLLVLRDALREPVHARTTTRCVDLLAEMRARRVQLAIVSNDLDAMVGIATLEDVLEEIVGEIEGEHDRLPPPSFVERPDGAVDVRGDAFVHDLNRDLGLDLPETGDFTSIAGLVLERVGRIPKPGHRVVLANAVELEVLTATSKRITRVRLFRPAPAS